MPSYSSCVTLTTASKAAQHSGGRPARREPTARPGACAGRVASTAWRWSRNKAQVVAGYFYDAKGQPTEDHLRFDERVGKAREAAARQALDKAVAELQGRPLKGHAMALATLGEYQQPEPLPTYSYRELTEQQIFELLILWGLLAWMSS